MTEEQRVKLEKLISEFEIHVEEVALASEHARITDHLDLILGRLRDKMGIKPVSAVKWNAENLKYARSRKEKARDRITDHLTLIQYDNALYNFQRFGVKDKVGKDLDERERQIHQDEEDMYEAGFIPLIGHPDDFPVGALRPLVMPKEEEDDGEIIEELGTLAEEERKRIQKKP